MGYMAVSGGFSRFLTVLVLICSLQMSAAAQDIPTDTLSPNDQGNLENTSESSADIASISELVGQGDDSLPTRYDDMAQEFAGARRSPIVFGRERGRSRFPGNSVWALGVGQNANSTERRGGFDGIDLTPPLDLSLDDEIFRSSIASNRSIELLQDEFVSSKASVDRHFALAESLRGISLMTLSYLDKTVAAGVTTAQEQADFETIQQLLKTLNQNMAKVGNAHRRRVFDDMDEKFETCMTGESESYWVGQPSWRSRYPEEAKKMVFDAYNLCEVPLGATGICGVHLNNKGRYHFCSCCMEKLDYAVKGVNGGDINWSDQNWNQLRPGNGISLNGEGYSLVERLFLGRNIPAGFLRERRVLPGVTETEPVSPQRYEAGILIYDFSALIRSLYGDVIYTTQKVRKVGQQAIEEANKRKFVRRYVNPLLSVPQWVSALRDAKTIRESNLHPFKEALKFDPSQTNIQERGYWENHEGMWLRYAAAMGSSLEFGICPALEQLLALEKANVLDDMMRNECAGGQGVTCPNTGGRTQQKFVEDLWTEASIGGVSLTVADLRAIVAMDGTSEGRRFVQAYCDTSAIEGFKRLHRRVSARALDFMVSNTKVPYEEKQLVEGLIKRVTTVLDLATQDSRSQVDQMLLALDALRDRRLEAIRAGNVQALGAEESRARLLGSVLQPFGGALPN